MLRQKIRRGRPSGLMGLPRNTPQPDLDATSKVWQQTFKHTRTWWACRRQALMQAQKIPEAIDTMIEEVQSTHQGAFVSGSQNTSGEGASLCNAVRPSPQMAKFLEPLSPIGKTRFDWPFLTRVARKAGVRIARFAPGARDLVEFS